MPRRLFIFLFCFFPILVQAVEPDWNKIEEELIDLLQKLIQVDTQNPPGNELAACRVLDKFFRKNGISSKIYRVDDQRANLLARLKGDGSQKAILLAAHTDVVPANGDKWSVDPFSGEVLDGYIYGRGAIDDKGMLAVHAMTLVLLKRQNVPLRRDVIFLATAGEESGGSPGIKWMLERHRPKLEAAFALNEGGRIIYRNGKPLYIALQTEEKQAYNINLTATGTTGHSSIPRLDNAIVSMAKALERLERRPMQQSLDAVTTAFFQEINRVDTAVVWTDNQVLTTDPLYLAILSNTIAPTIISGGIKSNVHPPSVELNLNCRLLPSQDVDEFVDSLRTWISPGPYSFDYRKRNPAPAPSPQDGLGYILIEQVCNELYPGTPVLPYLSPGMSDGTSLRHEGIPTYGLLPFPLDEEEVWRQHGVDERLSLESLMMGMKLVHRLVKLAGI
ncbi:M20/M25/M40 family metallo-hydrolase [bacterium]|nr:M20/M25/M40 family metallo-hydrolase [bacterium]